MRMMGAAAAAAETVPVLNIEPCVFLLVPHIVATLLFTTPHAGTTPPSCGNLLKEVPQQIASICAV